MSDAPHPFGFVAYCWYPDPPGQGVHLATPRKHKERAQEDADARNADPVSSRFTWSVAALVPVQDVDVAGASAPQVKDVITTAEVP